MSTETSREEIVLVQRDALVQAMIQIAAATPRMGAAEARLSVAGGALTITRAGTSASIPAEGEAHFETLITGLRLRSAKRLLPADDPLEIAFDGEYVRFGSFRYRANAEKSSQPLSPTDEKERNRRLSRAAAALEPYGVSVQDLTELCEEEPKMDARQAQPLKDRIAQAWAQLSAFGVGIEDLEYLVAQKLRNAWKR